MTAKTSKARAGDFVIHMESAQKCLTFGQVTAPAAGGAFDLDDVVAYPLLANNILALHGDEANVVAFLIAGDPIVALANSDDTSGPLYTILDDFDGVVLNEDMLPANDCAATPAAFTAATIRTAIEALGGKWVSEPDLQSIQTE